MTADDDRRVNRVRIVISYRNLSFGDRIPDC